MRCKTARRLMLLYRDGELPAARAARLEEHYVSCAACAREAGLIPETFAPLDSLRRQEPVLDDPRGLLMSIMRGVEEADRNVMRAGVQKPGRLLSMVRLLSGFVAAGFALLLVTLSTNDAGKIATLERNLLERQSDGGDPAAQLAREAASMLGPTNAGPELGQGIRRDEAGLVLNYFMHPRGRTVTVTIEDILLRKYPALASVTLQDGLDDRERQVLADEGARFVKDMEKLMRKEKGIHDR